MKSSTRNSLVGSVAALSLLCTTAGASASGVNEDPLSIAEAVVTEMGEAPSVTNPDVALPTDAEGTIVMAVGDGDVLTMDLPSEGGPVDDEGTSRTSFEGDESDVSLVAESTEVGFRALVQIESEHAPISYDFEMGGEVTELRVASDGTVDALNSAGELIASADAPWATDADGHAVPTHYQVDGTTLTQVVDHQGGGFAYPIVADPNWWKIGKCVAAVTWVVGSSVFAVSKITKIKGAIKGLGGIKMTAKLLVGATSKTEKAKVLGRAGMGAASYFLGIDTIRNNC